ncbi:MAG: hormogonium polysaccharide secretion pseudopilin HpsB [Nostocaceae cyanobacterium]|nr:hormogonium polysaccharide secretion pseudopilin HpsB [Nostocaceae cyanobacterium]
MNQLKQLYRSFTEHTPNLTPSYRTPLSLLRRGEGGEVSPQFPSREEGGEFFSEHSANLTPSYRTPLSLLRRGEGGEVSPQFPSREKRDEFFSDHSANLTPSYRTPLSLLRRGEGGEVYSRESGFTIVESLVAVVVAAILLAAIAPAIVLSTATRVQSRRIELGIQAARTYIDGLRAESISAENITAIDSDDTKTDEELLKGYDVPATGKLTCNNTYKNDDDKDNNDKTDENYCTEPATNLYCIDGDGDDKCQISSTKDFIIQAFRTPGDITAGYKLGIRVYRADGFSSDGGDLKKTHSDDDSNKSNKQGTVTAGLGDRKTPLFEITTAISSESDSFNDLCNRLKDDTKKDTTNNKCI